MNVNKATIDAGESSAARSSSSPGTH